jgi:hypothetical protein
MPRRIHSSCSPFISSRKLMRVSLVGTVHAESGLADVVELQAILERFQPDVIFAEIPSADVDQYRDGSRGSLESTSVGRYRESHQVAVVPVDLTRPEDEFFRNTQHLFDTVERTSPDYRRMMDRHSLNTRADGFPYLNSDRCIQSWADIYGEVLATVDWIRQPRLREIYDLWNHTNELRDTEMMKNIEDYCVRNVFVHGLFLVGAAHRKSIVDKARAGVGTGSPRIEWDLGGFLDGLD